MSHLIFTLDFHELVRGKLEPGTPCMIEYDPFRLIDLNSDYKFGDPSFQFKAHISYEPTKGQEELILLSDTGVNETPVIQLTGLGSMLKNTLTIPSGTREIIIFFTLTLPSGEVRYDSKFGENFHFRFIDQDIQIKKAKVETLSKQPMSNLNIAIKADPLVDKVNVRYRLINNLTEAAVEKTIEMQRGPKENLWTSGDTKIPNKSLVAYDIVYYLNGKKYKLDNNGNYYLAE